MRKTGVDYIAEERATHPGRGYDAEHDKGHAGPLASAAISYGAFASVTIREGLTQDQALQAKDIVPPMWPWSSFYWKPTGDPITDLAKAGSLIAATIDSLLAEQADED